jgi:hypothetical protein
VRNVAVEQEVSVTADPGSPPAGGTWYRSDLGQVRVRDGSSGGRGSHSITDSLFPLAQSSYWYPINLFSTNAGSSGIALTVSTEYAVPMAFGFNATLAGIALSVTTAGTNIRVGVRADTGGMLPGSVLYDGGTVAATTGVKTFTPGISILSGRIYWVTATPQGAGCSIACQSVAHCWVGKSTTPAAADFLTGWGAYTQGSVTAALPGTYTVSGQFTSTPKFMLQFTSVTK